MVFFAGELENNVIIFPSFSHLTENESITFAQYNIIWKLGHPKTGIRENKLFSIH